VNKFKEIFWEWLWDFSYVIRLGKLRIIAFTMWLYWYKKNLNKNIKGVLNERN